MVLTYHQVNPKDSPYLYGVTCTALEEHLALIKTLGTASPEVTFDDGHVSHHSEALPLLEKFGIRATFFVTAGWTGRQPEYMTVAQLKELDSLGHRVEAHGWSHKMLTGCTSAELYDELRLSKAVLEDHLGKLISAISLPHGRWNKQVLEACESAGYRQVYISEPGIRSRQRFGIDLIGRLMVTQRMTNHRLARILAEKKVDVAILRSKEFLKRTARSGLGEGIYHRLWCRLAADDQRKITPERPQATRRVLQLISSGGYYGAESMLVNLAEALNATGVQSTVGVFHNLHTPHTEVAEEAQRKGLKTAIIRCRGRIDRSAVDQIRELIRRDGIELVHTHGFKSNLYGSLAARALGIPLIATYHLDWPDKGFSLYLYHLLDRLVLRRFKKVVAVSGAIECSLRRARFPATKLTKIRNGIDLQPFVASSRVPHDSKTSPPASLVIALVGRLTPQKGHRYLLEAAPELLAEFPEIRFVLVGEGPGRQELQRRVAELRLEKHFTFAGARSDMPEVYRSIDILVLPSINEGLPMTLIEALAARRPVIASRVGDVPQLILHEETGLLIEPGDTSGLRAALRRFLGDPQLRSMLAAKGQEWVCENFSATTMADQYRRVYSEAVSTA